jgi:D-alanyl-D-alanine carboxypeptidase/D-alanyl-D-alanine-endopeptidase (penicillin-binding protein 4)
MSRPATAASCLVLACALAACAAPLASRGEAIPPLRPALDELLGRPELAGGRVGVLVVDPRDGARLCASDDDRGFATASNMKVLSAVVALTTLGPDWRTTTQLRVRGEVVDGALRGDLVLVGRGDPLFAAGPDAAATWDRFAAGLRALGVARVEGRVVGDGAWLGAETLGRGWSWDSLDEDYAAPFGGLCCARNVVTVRVAPGDGAPVATLAPDVLPPPDVRARMLAPGERGALQVNRRLGSERIVVSGGLARDAAPATFAVAVADPAAFAARVLRRELAARGIAVVDGPGARPDAVERIAAVEVSASLREWLTPTLLRSDNLCAEQIARLAAREALADGASAAMARHAAAALERLGVDPRGLAMADGSGLSRRNLAQPRQIVGALLAARAAPWRDDFLAALPTAGRSGTLAGRFRDGPAHGRVRAKTGAIDRVVSLAGYVPRPDPSAPPLVFAGLVNDHTCDAAAARGAVDAFVQRLAAHAGW